MNTVWLKIAALAVVIIGLIITVNYFKSSGPKSGSSLLPPQKSYQDVIAEDDKRLRPKEDEQSGQAVQPGKPAEPNYRKLDEEQKIEAERLFEMALTQRKMARLPGMSYKQMVDYCRELIEKFPDTVYAAKAREMLGEVPERKRQLYNITDEEINPTK